MIKWFREDAEGRHYPEKTLKKFREAENKVRLFGRDILSSPGMQKEKEYIQHGRFSVYAHSFLVASLCVYIAEKLPLRLDTRSLVRGALLHDYFLYDWHTPDKSHRLHAFSHAKRALENARRDFRLNRIERNMIHSHMFPLNTSLPRYRESIILCAADKLCAVAETLRALFPPKSKA